MYINTIFVQRRIVKQPYECQIEWARERERKSERKRVKEREIEIGWNNKGDVKLLRRLCLIQIAVINALKQSIPPNRNLLETKHSQLSKLNKQPFVSVTFMNWYNNNYSAQIRRIQTSIPNGIRSRVSQFAVRCATAPWRPVNESSPRYCRGGLIIIHLKCRFLFCGNKPRKTLNIK